MTAHADLVINENQAESASQVLWRTVAYITRITEAHEGIEPEDFTLSDLRRIAANLATDPTQDSQLFTADRPVPSYWHVYGGPKEWLQDDVPTVKFTKFAYGPTYMPGNSDVRAQGYPFQGDTFPYITTFTHEPTQDELNELIPEKYRTQ